MGYSHWKHIRDIHEVIVAATRNDQPGLALTFRICRPVEDDLN